MEWETFTALALFAVVTSITPGPNNLMLMASGANFGFRRSIPHMLGIGIGFSVMLFCVGVGLMQVFIRYPVSLTVLKVVSVLYLCWLAWKIANAAPPKAGAETGKPLTFMQAALFQWANPKGWAMALTAVTVYAEGQDVRSVFLVAVIFGCVGMPTIGTWTILGQQMRRFLTNPRRLRVFNWVMAVLLIASLYPVLLT